MRLIGRRVFVRPIIEEKVRGVIHCMEDADLASQKGEVMYIGNIDWIKEGETILFTRFGGKTMQLKDGINYRLIGEEDILAVLRGENDR